MLGPVSILRSTLSFIATLVAAVTIILAKTQIMEYLKTSLKLNAEALERMYPLIVAGGAYSGSNDLLSTFIVTGVFAVLDGLSSSGIVHIPFLSSHVPEDQEEGEEEQNTEE